MQRVINEIIVVEDSESLKNLLVDKLAKLGYSTVGFSLGAEAINYISKKRDVLVLLDHILPDMTGRDVAEYILKEKMGIPFIFMTGSGDERLATKLMKLGAADYIVKDSEFLETLPKVIERVIQSTENERKIKKYEQAHIQKSKDNEFLASLSYQLADSNEKNIIEDIALPLIRKHTGAIYAHFATYNRENKTTSVNHIESESILINTIKSIGGEKIFSKEYRVSDSLHKKLIETKLLQSDSLHELSGGAVPESVSKALKNVVGFDTLYSIPQIHKGELYGETTLAFLKNQDLPSTDLLESFSNILAVSIRNSITESSLKQSEEKFRSLAENATDIIWTMDFGFNITYVSPSVKQILGFSEKEYYKLTIEEKHPLHQIEIFKNLLEAELNNENIKCTDKNRVLRLETQHFKADGSIAILELSLSYIRNENNTLIGIQGISRDITRIKRIEEELRQKEQKLSTALKMGKMGHWELDVKSGIFTFSDSFYAIFGTTAQEIGGYKLSIEEYANRFVHPYDAFMVAEETKRAIESKDPNMEAYVEHRMLYADGTEGYIAVRFLIVKDNKGNTIKTYGVNQDITERKKAELEILVEKQRTEESEMRFKALHNASFGGIAIHDKGIILDCNQGLSEMMGYTMDELIGMDGLQLIAVESRDYVRNKIATGHEKPYEAFGRKKNGEEFPMRLEARNIPYKGKTVRTVEFRDLTLQKQTEQKLHDSERLHRSLVKGLPDIVMRFDRDGRHLFVSENVNQVVDVEATHFIGKTHCELGFPDNMCKMWENSITRVFETGSEFETEFTFEGKNGYITFNWRLTPERNEEGFISSVLSISRDITKQKQNELIIHKQKKELEDLNASKDKFLQILSHDLRNPMSALMLNSEMLYENFHQFDDSKKIKFLESIKGASLASFNLLDKLLTWSKSQAGKLSFEPTNFSINTLINETIDTLSIVAKSKRITLYHLKTGTVMVYADRDMISAVLRNLISNSIKFTLPNGKVNIFAAEMEQFIEVSVVDNGIGMSKESMDNLFRIDSIVSTIGTAKEHGSGLGLMICRDFVEKHGGTIVVESKEGKGSTFTIKLPKVIAKQINN